MRFERKFRSAKDSQSQIKQKTSLNPDSTDENLFDNSLPNTRAPIFVFPVQQAN